MTEPLLVVPPLADPTLEPVPLPGERLLDLNRAFWQRIGDPCALRDAGQALDVPGPETASTCLLALAGADALCEPIGTQAHLRGLAAAVRVLSADDPGLTASVDDVHLAVGDTQSSGDATRAASATVLLRPELDRGAQAFGVGEVRVLVDTDQQLPAVLGLPLGRGSVLLGRFAQLHAQALSRMPALDGVRLDTGSRKAQVGGLGTPEAAGVAWVTRPGDCPADDRWAGWLDAADAVLLDEGRLTRCTGLVLSVCRLDSEGQATGADGQSVDLSGVLAALSGIASVAIELLAGAPGVSQPEFDRTVAAAARLGIRLAGCRPFRLSCRFPHRTWAGIAVSPEPDPAHDLARWARTAPAAEVRAEDLLPGLAAAHDLFPGKLAGALFAPGQSRPLGRTDTYGWDPAVRQVRTVRTAPAGARPGDFLVNLRTGHIARLPAALALLTAELAHGGHRAATALERLEPARRTALVARLRAVGALVRTGGTRHAA